MNLFLIFLTGLTTGGLSCLAMQGGLLTSVIANQKEQEHEALDGKEERQFRLRSFDQLDWLPVGMFLLSKLLAHSVLGFLLGALGSAISLSLGIRLSFQLFTAFFMFATAMNLLNVHPLFRYVAFQPPPFLQRYIRNSSKSKALFAPAILGLLTIFIPCGVTQAMEVLAINAGSPVLGAAIMFAFVLGTMPLFALLGVATAKLSEGWYQSFTRVAALVLVAMAVYSINGVLLVLDSPYSLQSLSRSVWQRDSSSPASGQGVAPIVNGVQKVSIAVMNDGYEPKYLRVQAGLPVELTLRSQETYSCALSFVLRQYGINTFLEATDSKTFRFTPTEPGRYTYACSMGMYTGTLEVL